ncbi:UNVERIFIED_CONTAM: hypothetical protein K2H54_036505 [Gekko kuhli]
MEDKGKDCLLKTLEQLKGGEVRVFLDKLNLINPKQGYMCFSFRIPDHKLLTDFLLDNYGVDYGIEVTVKVLKAMNLEALAKELVEFQCNDKHFVDQHRNELIERISGIDKVLGHMHIDWNDSLYLAVRKEDTDVLKMQKLYELMPSRNRKFKDDLYHSLLVTNRYLIEELQGVDFFMKYKKELIRRISWVGSNLQMRLHDILDHAEYEAIMAESTDNQKMEKLYELLPSWDRRRKFQLYQVLKSTDRGLILQLEAGHFVEQEQNELIQRTSRVPEVLRRLVGVALTHDQYKDIMYEPKDILRMRMLYNLVPQWNKEQKDHLYKVLLDTNRFLITELKGKNFVDRHEHELVQRVTEIGSILQQLVPLLLEPEQYKAIMAESTDEQKKEKLYEIMLSWDRGSKDQLYHALKSRNRRLVLELEAQHFVERHKDELIHRVFNVPHVLDVLKMLEVLDHHQYEKIMAAGTNRQKMKKLYELVSNWNNKSKDCLYQALRETNARLLKEIEGGNFVERYQKELIEKVSGMDVILFRLLGFILSHGQYCHIMTEETDAGKMKKLFELVVPAWEVKEKNWLYRELIRTNGLLITALEGGSEPGNLEASPSDTEHFIEKHQEELIRCVSGVDIVLSFALSNQLITKEQNQEIKGSPQQQMQKLFVLVGGWMTAGKEKLQCTLTETNPRLIAQLAGGHFVDRHREELIERVTEVPLNQLRGSALDEEQYEALLNCATEKMQMQALFQMVQEWNRQQKDQLYRALVDTNPDAVTVLEEEHFIEKHQEELIHRVSRVDAILRRLLVQHSLIKEGSDQQKMEQLYTLVPSWNRKEKDHLYMVLKKTNGPLVAELEEGHFVERHKEQLIQNVTKVKIVVQSLLHYQICRRLYINLLEKDTDKEKMEILYKVVPDWNGEWKNRLYQELRATNASLIKELEGMRSSKEGFVTNPLAEEKCYLCEKEKGFPVIQPELIPAKGKLKTYRIHLPRAGIFLCAVTELKFEVRAAVTVKYTYSSWDQHLSEAEMQNWMVAGPLFDIRADPGGEVAAVHLPHFICLQEGKTDVSQMKIAHFIDAGMTLEKPSQVTQFHVVLENPEFSVLGVLLKPIQRLIPVHSVVLLYQIFRKTTLHLYLVPNDSSLIQAIEDREKSRQSVLVDKHPQTDEPLYYGSYYFVFSSAKLVISPEKLEFSYKTPGQLQSFVDVYLGNIERVNLSLKKKEGLLSVWDAWLESGPSNQEENSDNNRGSWFPWFLELFGQFQLTHDNIERSSGSAGTRCPTQVEGTARAENPPSSWRRREREAGVAPVLQQGTQATPSLEPHFIEQHREELIRRTTTVEGVLDLLYGIVLDEEQYQRISLRETNPDKMRELYRLVPSWDCSCKDRLYEALRQKNPFLIAELERR